MNDPEDDFERPGGLQPERGGGIRWWQWPILIIKGIWALLRGKGDFS